MNCDGSGTWPGVSTLVGVDASDRYDWSDNSSSAADRPSHFAPPAPATASDLARPSHARPASLVHINETYTYILCI